MPLFLKQFFEGFVCPIGGWQVTRNAADQIGHLVIEAVRKDGIRTFGNSIANDSRLRNARETRRLAEARFGPRVKANAFHAAIVLQIAQKCITCRNRL